MSLVNVILTKAIAWTSVASVTDALTFKPFGWPTMVQFRAVDNVHNAFILSQQYYNDTCVQTTTSL